MEHPNLKWMLNGVPLFQETFNLWRVTWLDDMALLRLVSINMRYAIEVKIKDYYRHKKALLI